MVRPAGGREKEGDRAKKSPVWLGQMARGAWEEKHENKVLKDLER